MSREVEERNIHFIESLFAVTGAGDWDTAQTMVTEDFQVSEADSLPFPGVFTGIPGLKKLYELVMSSLGVAAIKIQQMTAGGDRVIVVAEFELEASPSERIQLLEMFRFRDGKVCAINAYYYDHAAVWRAVEARKQAHAAGPG